MQFYELEGLNYNVIKLKGFVYNFPEFQTTIGFLAEAPTVTSSI